jgi:hypothetical protein
VLELRDGGPDRERTRHRRDAAPARATRPASRSATRAARQRRGREELLWPPKANDGKPSSAAQREPLSAARSASRSAAPNTTRLRVAM